MIQLLAEMNLGCFREHYGEARRQFLDCYEQLPANLRQGLEAVQHPLTGPGGEVLACDVAWLGQGKHPEKLLVLISGTHGVEGFAGSAIQADCLPLLAEVLAQEKSLGVVVFHALNPWGFAWHRRYDHEGIDLNRNFVDFNQPLPNNPEYETFHTWMLNQDILVLKNLKQVWQSTSMAKFTDVITRGQYTVADGSFFGGSGPSWSRQLLEKIVLKDPFIHVQRAAVIDLHTGLGPFGYGELINDHEPDTPGDEMVTHWYGANACSAIKGESVSSVKSGLLDFFWHRQLGGRGCFVTLEFGTYPQESLLLTLLQEQRYQSDLLKADAVRDLDNHFVRALLDFFYPRDRSWKQQVIFRGRQVISMALEGMQGG